MAINYWQDFAEGEVYHIYNRGNNREDIFKEKRNYWYFMSKWLKYISPYMDLYAFCLMPNHFHLIARVRDIDESFFASAKGERTIKSRMFIHDEIPLTSFISYQYKRMFSAYALGINQAHNRIGSLFQKRFKRVRIRNEHQLVERICYVHYNPRRHLGHKTFSSWHYSSYLHYKYNRQQLIKTASMLKLLDQNEVKARQEFFRLHRAYEREFAYNVPVFYSE